MSSFEIRSVTLADVMDNPRFGQLIADYARECANPGMGVPNPNREQYEAMEKVGMFYLLGAYRGDEMVGFVTYLLTPMAHFSNTAATVESLFLDPRCRHGLLGVRLIKAALKQAKSLGAKGLYLSAPSGSQLEKLANALHFKQTNVVFFAS